MTDARLPERFLMDRRLAKVSGEVWGFGYCTSLMWAVSNRTDGFLSDDDLKAIPYFKPEYAMELVRAGWWARNDIGWWIVDFGGGVQTSKASLESADRAREADARYHREVRAQAKEDKANTARRELIGELVGDDVGGYVGPDVGADASKKPLEIKGFPPDTAATGSPGHPPRLETVGPDVGHDASPTAQDRTETGQATTVTVTADRQKSFDKAVSKQKLGDDSDPWAVPVVPAEIDRFARWPEDADAVKWRTELEERPELRTPKALSELADEDFFMKLHDKPWGVSYNEACQMLRAAFPDAFPPS